jgi:hypothetical protein
MVHGGTKAGSTAAQRQGLASETVGDADKEDRQHEAWRDTGNHQPARAGQAELRPGRAEGQRDRIDNRESDKDGDQKPIRRWPLIILGVVVAAIVAAIVYCMTRGLESTGDACTEGNAIAFARRPATLRSSN